MGKGPAKGPSKGTGRGGYSTAEVSDDFLEHFSLGRRSLTSRGPYRLLAHSSGEERSGEYLFDIDTGKLQITESLESIGQFSTEALVLEVRPIPIDRPADELLPCIQVLSSEVMREIQNPENAGAFVVLPSQFNGVEFPSHCSIVESVEDYKYDHTGGPCGQLATHPGLAQFLLDNACTHRRTNGLDATRQLLRKVNGALEEKGIFSKKQQFSVLNGYLKMPVPESEEVAASILDALIGSLHELRLLLMRDALTCGLAPSKTEFSHATHRVNLVYASAVPVNAYVNGIGAVAKGFGDDQMQAFQRNVAELFLIAQYLGALQVASNTAKVLKARSKVLLMPLGGGAFKNSWESIVKSIAMAVELCQSDLDLLDIHVLVLDGGKAGKSDDTPAEQRVKELLQKHQKLRGT